MTNRYQKEFMQLCAAEQDEDDPVVIEAVEALATLACCSTVAGLETPRQKELTTAMTDPDRLPSQAEKETRRLHCVLANRESARQTIRHREAMHLELIKKEADLSKENENLKKGKELAVKEYNSLKVRNEFLKLQIANVKNAEPREIQEEPTSFQAKIATFAATNSPIFLYNQPSLVPFFWPFIPSSNFIQLQYTSHSDVMSSSQFSPRHRDIPSSRLGQEIFLGNTGP